ncbi:MAG: tRNA-uridine aminocarboxypropyltransferase [Treponemataceae bacterium]
MCEKSNEEFSKCYNCFRPKKSCYCKYIKNFDSGIKFLILMHPKEAYKQKTGTGRLAHLSLKDSEILIGIDFSKDQRLSELLNDSQYFPVLLYPDKNAWKAENPELKNSILNTNFRKKLLVIVVDATWFCAKKMVRLNSFLHSIPKISFINKYKSQFTFKHQPEEECLSSIESIYYLIKELQTTGIANECDPEPLIKIFKYMVNFQIDSMEKRIENGIPNRYHKKK